MLNFPRGPSTVARLVVSFWIDAVERQAFWTTAHVFNEGGEVISPAITDGHASRAVKPIVRGRHDVAARLHTAPRNVFAPVSDWHVIVFVIALRSVFILLASATLRVAVQQILSHLHRALSAVALTQPVTAPNSLCWGDYEQASEALSYQGGAIEASQRAHLRLLLFAPQTSATLHIAAVQIASRCDVFVAAIADASIARFRALKAFYRNQSPEPSARVVFAPIRHLLSVSRNRHLTGVLCEATP